MLPVCILAGGLATRMLPMTEKIPKALLPVGGTPFLDLQLAELERQGILRVVLCIGHLGDQIEQHIRKSKRRLDIACSYDGELPLGTGGAVKKAIPLLGEHFFVLYGDSWLSLDYREVQEKWEESGEKALMTVYKNDGRWDKSNAKYDGRRVFYQKRAPASDMDYIDYGLGILSADCFETFSGNFDLAEVYEALSAENRLAGWESAQRFYEIGSPAGLGELEKQIRGMKG